MFSSFANLRTVSNHDGATVLDIGRGLISTLNPTGAFVWLALQRGESVEQIVTALVEQTGMERNTIEGDVDCFLRALREQHLLKDGE